MPFNINEFVQGASTGFAREAHFEVQFNLPKIVPGDGRKLSFLCHAANIPGRRIEKVNVRRYGMGFSQPFAIGTAYDSLSLDFYCDGRAQNLKTIHKWADSIFSFSNDHFQQVEYSDNYTTTLSLIQYDVTGKTIAQWSFYDVFPEVLPSVNLNWSTRNSIIIVPVVFGYSRYEEKSNISDTATNSITGNIKSGINNLLDQVSPVNVGAALGRKLGSLLGL